MRAARGRIMVPTAALAMLMVVSACAGTEPSGSAAPAATSAPGSAPATSAPPPSEPASSTPSASAASPTPSTTTKLPTVDLGTVTNTRSTKQSGSGSAELVLHRKGKTFGVVVQVDCSKCRGRFELTAPKRMTPFGRSSAPLKASYLVNIDKVQPNRQSLRLTATGPWRITVLSWNQLPVVTGEQSGKGSDVLYLGDKSSKLRVKAKPAGQDDRFGGRVFTESARPVIFGNDKAFTETIDEVDLPGVIAITTNGTWTITPKK